MLFKLMTLVNLCAAFPLKCPEPAQWRLRANSHCADPSKYFCLRNDIINGYSENCTRSDFQQAGRKSVLRGGIDAVVCSKERYQPYGYTLYTNASTNCILLKSFCNEEGQVVYDHGNRTTDATCICNYRRGFAFLIKPNNPCFCKPSQEDCSCFLKICSNSSHILSPEYKCTINSDLPPVTQCRAITDENDNSGRKPEVKELFPKEDNVSVFFLEPWKERSVIAILSIFGTLTLVLFILVICIRQFKAFENNGPEPELNLIEGDTLTLQYMIPIKRLRLCFFKDDTLIAETVNVKKHVLEKTNVTLGDQGNYFAKVCKIRSRITKVTVQSMFTSEFNTIKCIEGEMLQLKCSVYSEDINVEWSKVDSKDRQNENISIEIDGKDHCLTIQQAKLSDAGQYMMAAGNVRKQVTVTVEAMFTSEYKPIKCVEGETLELKCSVYSEDINVEWSKDETDIKQNENISIEIAGKDHCLTIQQAKLSDAGLYVTVAGNVRKQLTVTVEAMFTSEFNEMNCIIGEQLKLKCSVYLENINVEWFKNDTKIVKNENISIKSVGKDHFMSVQQVEMMDAGQYLVIAGNVQKQITVTVKVLPEAINRLQEKDRARYIKLMQSSEVEKRYFVRIMIVGKESVGKTSLVRRLLKEEKIDDVTSTDGVDIVVHRCKINVEDGKWMIDKFTSDDKGDRINRAVKNESIKKDMSKTISHEQCVIASKDEVKHIEVQAKNHNDISDTTTLPDLETSTRMPKIKSEKSKGEEDSCHDSVSMATHDTKANDQTLETIGKIEDEGNIKADENDINNDTKDISIENEDTKKSLTLVMPSNLVSHVFSKTSTSNIPSNHYALCGLWDFAGQKEFYATHQAFLTSSAIYLVVADMADNICKEGKKQCFADFQNVGEYVDFWFDTIHCHRTIEPRVNESNNDHIDPPVILVLTGKDKYEKDKERRKTDLQNQLDVVLRNQSKYHHLRRIFCLSNKTDPYNEFEKLQEEISTTVRGMKTWGEEMPLKWILLEHLIEINKNNGKKFISLSDMTDLAKHSSINIIDIEEVKLFLCFQHEIGNIIYFEDIQDFIILKPKWLVNAFRCLVSDRIDDKLQHRTDSTTFVQNGQISESLIFEHFKSKCGSQFSDQIANLLKVMEKFDILINIDETSSYIMPSMMKSALFDDVCTQIGVKKDNCKKTSWLCLKFEFLPPSFFNHVSLGFIRRYNPTKMGDENKSLALFRGICVFDFDRSGCEKLLVTMSTDIIAIQLLSFSTGTTEFISKCSNIYEDLIEQVQAIKKRYRMTLYYEPHFKCSSGEYFKDTTSYKDLKCSAEFQCLQHNEAHQSKELYLPWMNNAEKIWKDYKDLLQTGMHFLTEELTQWLSDFDKTIPENLQVAQINLDKIKVMLERISGMKQTLKDTAHICQNLGVNIDNLRKKEAHKESSVNELVKKVDDKLKVTTGELERKMNSIRDTIHQLELVDMRRRDVGSSLPIKKEESQEMEENLVKLNAKTVVKEKAKQKELQNSQNIGKDYKHSRSIISQENENYARLSLLLSGISSRAVRVLFDREFHPSCLQPFIRKNANGLQNLLRKRIINKSQWKLLFPRSGGPCSETFDVTLMITLVNHFARFANDHRYDTLPSAKNTTLSADLARIKYYKNFISNNQDGKIDNTLFSTAWYDTIEAVGRLGGKNMLDECEELRTTTLGHSTVPWNIRVQISQILEAWKINNSTFVETRAAKHVLKCVREHSCVTITAGFGVGKTAILQHVALKMADEGYDVVIVDNTQDIVRYFIPNQKTLFVMDDFCGTYSINQFDLNSLESVMVNLKVMIQKKIIKIIVACRLQVYQDAKFEFLSIFRTCVCNLQSKDLCLSLSEKLSIAKFYLETKASEIIQYSDLYYCFPLICKLYNDNLEQLNIKVFFRNPFSIYQSEIDMLLKKGNNCKYCVLALCVMFNNCLKEEWFIDEVNSEIHRIIENTCEACKLDRGTSRLILLDELKTLEKTFIRKEQGVHKTINENIFDFLSLYFGKRMIQCVIRNADIVFFMQRFLLQHKDGMNQFITVLPPQYHQMYIQRMSNDWSKGRVQCVFNNINMKLPQFRQKFLCFLNTLEISQQRQLALTCDVDDNDTVLLQSCLYDDIPLIQWCINLGVDVNKCNYKGMSPLYISAQEGLTKVVMLLLDNKADINKCTDAGASPLFVACQKNHTEIVKLLLDKKAVIDKGMDDATSPLLIAKKMNHIDIVRMLEENGASE